MLTIGVGGPAFLILRYWPDRWRADSCLAGSPTLHDVDSGRATLGTRYDSA